MGSMPQQKQPIAVARSIRSIPPAARVLPPGPHPDPRTCVCRTALLGMAGILTLSGPTRVAVVSSVSMRTTKSEACTSLLCAQAGTCARCKRWRAGEGQACARWHLLSHTRCRRWGDLARHRGPRVAQIEVPAGRQGAPRGVHRLGWPSQRVLELSVFQRGMIAAGRAHSWVCALSQAACPVASEFMTDGNTGSARAALVKRVGTLVQFAEAGAGKWGFVCPP